MRRRDVTSLTGRDGKLCGEVLVPGVPSVELPSPPCSGFKVPEREKRKRSERWEEGSGRWKTALHEDTHPREGGG